MGVDRGDRAAFLGEDIEECVEIVGGPILTGGEDAVHRQALVLALAADEHPRPVATDCGEMVVPPLNSAADVLFHPLALRWALQPLDHPGVAAFVGPRRNDAR